MASNRHLRVTVKALGPRKSKKPKIDLSKPLPIWPLNVMVLLLVGVVFSGHSQSTSPSFSLAALASVFH